MTLLDPACYRRQPWKNGLGESLEIAAEREDGATEGFDRLLWSLTFTSFDAPTRFSDLTGFDRIMIRLAGRGLVLRALDGGQDITVPLAGNVAFGGGRVLEGVPDGRVKVLNLIGRRRRAGMALELLKAGSGRRSFAADVLLVFAVLGAARFAGTPIPKDATLRLDGARIDAWVEGESVVVASIDRIG